MTEEDIRKLITEKTMEISIKFHSQANQLNDVIKSHLKNIDFNKYNHLLVRCEKLIDKAEKWDRFEEQIQQVLEFRKNLIEIRKLLMESKDEW